MESIRDRELNIVGERFSSFLEAYRVCDGRSLNRVFAERGDGSALALFCADDESCFSPADTRAALLYGDGRYHERFLAASEQVGKALKDRYEWIPSDVFSTDVYGQHVIVERYAAGHPKAFSCKRVQPRRRRSVNVFYDIACAASTPVNQRIESGSIVLAVADALDKMGYEVALTLSIAKFGGNSMADDPTLLMEVALKNYGEPLNPKRLEFPLAGKPVLFHLGALWAHRFPGAPSDYNGTEGYPLSYDRNRVKKMCAYAEKNHGVYLSEDIVELQLGLDPTKVLERVLTDLGDAGILEEHLRKTRTLDAAVDPEQGRLFGGGEGDGQGTGDGQGDIPTQENSKRGQPDESAGDRAPGSTSDQRQVPRAPGFGGGMGEHSVPDRIPNGRGDAFRGPGSGMGSRASHGGNADVRGAEDGQDGAGSDAKARNEGDVPDGQGSLGDTRSKTAGAGSSRGSNAQDTSSRSNGPARGKDSHRHEDQARSEADTDLSLGENDMAGFGSLTGSSEGGRGQSSSSTQPGMPQGGAGDAGSRDVNGPGGASRGDGAGGSEDKGGSGAIDSNETGDLDSSDESGERPDGRSKGGSDNASPDGNADGDGASGGTCDAGLGEGDSSRDGSADGGPSDGGDGCSRRGDDPAQGTQGDESSGGSGSDAPRPSEAAGDDEDAESEQAGGVPSEGQDASEDGGDAGANARPADESEADDMERDYSFDNGSNEQRDPEEDLKDYEDDPFIVTLRKRYMRFERGDYLKMKLREQEKEQKRRSAHPLKAPGFNADAVTGQTPYEFGTPRSSPFSMTYRPKRKD